MTQLAERLHYELKAMTQIIKQTEQFIKQLTQETNPIYQEALTSAIAFNLHSFYTGVERIFEAIAKQIDQYQPSGSNWHKQLLNQMLIEVPNIRSAVISENTYKTLDELRQFRHVVRKIYAYDLDKELIFPLATKSRAIARKLG
jgi:ribosomal protein L31